MINRYRVKICGITDEVNYSELKKYQIDYFGFIFYEKSPRYILNNPDHAFIKNIKNKVAVFVDENIDTVISILEKYNFSYVQLHGNESSNYCMKLKSEGIKIVKSYLINSHDDLINIKMHKETADYFLFDYKPLKGELPGGNSKSFDWNLLKNLETDKPWFLSGGININNIKQILNDINPFGIDLSSGVEKELGIKDNDIINNFIEKLNNA